MNVWQHPLSTDAFVGEVVMEKPFKAYASKLSEWVRMRGEEDV
jgi:hypothetical protein